MRQSFSCVLDSYRFALDASRIEAKDRENLEIAEQVFLATNNFGSADVAAHFSQFKGFLAAIDMTPSRQCTTHILRFSRSSIAGKFKDAFECDPAFPLFDFSNSEVEERLRLAEVEGYLAQSLIASAIDHSAEAIWQFLCELIPTQATADELRIFLNCKEWERFDHAFPLFLVGDLISIDAEA